MMINIGSDQGGDDDDKGKQTDEMSVGAGSNQDEGDAAADGVVRPAGVEPEDNADSEEDKDGEATRKQSEAEDAATLALHQEKKGRGNGQARRGLRCEKRPGPPVKTSTLWAALDTVQCQSPVNNAPVTFGPGVLRAR